MTVQIPVPSGSADSPTPIPLPNIPGAASAKATLPQ